jgi:hypothetical protein
MSTYPIDASGQTMATLNRAARDRIIRRRVRRVLADLTDHPDRAAPAGGGRRCRDGRHL